MSLVPFRFISWDSYHKRQINKRKTNKFTNMYISCIHKRYTDSEKFKEVALEFRIKYHLNRKKERCTYVSWGKSKWFLGKTNGPLKEQMRGMIVCNNVFAWMWCGLLSCDKSIFLGWGNSLGRDLGQLSSFWRICL